MHMKSRRTAVILLICGTIGVAAWGMLREDERPAAEVDEALVAAMEEDGGDEVEEEEVAKETRPIRLSEEKRMRMRQFLETSRALRERSRRMSEGSTPEFVPMMEMRPREPEEGPAPDPEADFEAAVEAELMGVKSESAERISGEQREKIRKLRETIRSFSVDTPREE